jgi:DNA-directed RNA polymerase specialized sigma24 family protein
VPHGRCPPRKTVFISTAMDVDEWAEYSEPSGVDATVPSAERVERALMGLNAAHREAFLLKYVEDLSYDEISVLTGAGVSALKMRVSRAREFLRASLQELADG